MKTPLTLDFKKNIKKIFGNITNSQQKQIAQLYDLATKDAKTGLYNNHFFENMLEIEMERAHRQKQHLCLFMVDIDFFKKVNEIHGHVKADELLKRLADILKQQLRKTDIPARFGGEEFFIILPHTSLDQAKALTSRLRDAIKTDKVLGKYNITVSGGLTCYKHKDSEKSLKERADKALFKAKQTGRDKFVALE